MSYMTLTTPISQQSVIPRLTLDRFYLQTKYDDSRFSRSGDMTAGVKTENGSRDPDHAPFRGGLSSVG